MRRVGIFIVVGLVMFGFGFGGGLYVGRLLAPQPEPTEGPRVTAPGPIVPVGEFTSNLAGSGRNIISFTVAVEALNARAAETLNNAGWLVIIRNEILLTVKDKVFEDLTSAEGALQFAEEIRRALNSQLPAVRGEAPVARVLFESFVLQ